MRDITPLRRGAAIALLPLFLVACHSSSTSAGKPTPHAPETAIGAATILQAAGVYPAGQVHVSTGKDLQSLNGPGSYPGVRFNVFSPSGDEVTIWQFATASDAASALGGDEPALTVDPGDYDIVCGPLLIVGDTQAKTSAARSALAKRYTDCKPVAKAP
jgi:hypothetical protein